MAVPLLNFALTFGAAVPIFPPESPLSLPLFYFSPFSSLLAPFFPTDGIPLGYPALAVPLFPYTMTSVQARNTVENKQR